jgi:hypothetical protein
MPFRKRRPPGGRTWTHSFCTAARYLVAGSENSDQVLSGNSDHLPVALPGQKIVGHSASDEERMIDMLKRRIAAEDLRRGADIKSYFTELSLVEAFFMI